MKFSRAWLLALLLAAPHAFAAGIASKSPLRQHVLTYTFSTTTNISAGLVGTLPQANMVLKDVVISQGAAGVGGTSWVAMPKRAGLDLLTTAGGFTLAGGASLTTNALSSPMQVLANPTGGTRPIIKRNTSATQTVTVGAGLEAGDVLTIGGIAFTARASGASGWEFNIGANENADATSLAALINSHPNVPVVASAASAVVTLTAKRSGTVGNAITVAQTGDGYTLGSSTLASGYDYGSSGGSIVTIDVTLTGSYSTAVSGIVTLFFEPAQ